ncbi:hypothetical protein [Sporosarcina sp. G11-34]|uniref:hypothetical protein n=1 Tax=Sporosarcina sp. G11-34 TaxID=2849605 RepID=UPI0022A94DF7|nr:hypothetical protein [Sporosarcina sp. G11-34]MCZ2256954.1 hypothetical protein [Sporosarcina sp. G11-34]
MDKNKETALELAKILIQKNNVVPVSTISSIDSKSIQYNIDDVNYSFFEIINHFLESIDRIDDI